MFKTKMETSLFTCVLPQLSADSCNRLIAFEHQQRLLKQSVDISDIHIHSENIYADRKYFFRINL